ncbi:uncharacterized protein LOC135217575 [Macrobrachium nipponense]|uniref:uncharacterized protein LOC135217575 n=1 Tax=Macrobrachium nipponense TaxID=159736 RepID=UPI0030C84109
MRAIPSSMGGLYSQILYPLLPPSSSSCAASFTKAIDMFTAVGGCKIFAKIDLKQASTQLGMEEKSQQIRTLNTPLGLYKPKRHPHVGIGLVLAHVMPGGAERPIAFAPRALNKAERNYSQMEKEGLALIFGVKKFHIYVYG